MDYLQEKPSLILKRQRARESRKEKTVRETLLWTLKLSFGFLAALIFCLGVYWATDRIKHSPKFDVAIKEINGLQYISQSLVLTKITELEDHSRNIIKIDLDRLRRKLELLPWVQEVAVRRVLPHKLIIDIVERSPIAFARVARGILLIDEQGVLLENNLETLAHFDFPLILGIESDYETDVLQRNRQRIGLYQELIRSLDKGGAGLSRDVSEVHLHDLGNVSVILNRDTVLVHLGREDFQEKFRRYLATSRELKRKYPHLDSVDLRYKNQVVIRTLDRESVPLDRESVRKVSRRDLVGG